MTYRKRQMTYRIRKALARDLEEIGLLFHETVARINSRDYSPEQVGAWQCKASRERWEELWQSGLVFWVAENGEKQIVGFASATAGGYLHSMFVHYAFQHAGIATALLKQAEDFSVKNKISVLTSDVSITARPFFERRGFTLVREQQVDLGGTYLTNYSMAKILNPLRIYAGRIPACGVYCGGCPTFTRGKNPCPGATLNAARCETCKTFHLCCREKGITHCYACDVFPCVKFRSFAKRWLKYGQDFIENQYVLKRIGEEEFLNMYQSKVNKLC